MSNYLTDYSIEFNFVCPDCQAYTAVEYSVSEYEGGAPFYTKPAATPSSVADYSVEVDIFCAACAAAFIVRLVDYRD